ncbi:PKD domain-containing protein [Bacteroidota bacterium]
MKNKSFILFSISIILFITISCNKNKVEALFTIGETELTVNNPVTFINESVNADYYQWDFDDGSYSIIKSPTHTYVKEGIYEIKLVAIGDKNADDITSSITVINEITIYEGKGIDEVDLNETWINIKSSYTLDTLYYVDYNSIYDVYYHTVYYYNEGLAFIFIKNSSTLLGSDRVFIISMVEPYEGATSAGIIVGSSMERVIEKYGEPDDEYNENGDVGYSYSRTGIDFYSFDNSGNVDRIDIYEPYGKKSSPVINYSELLKIQKKLFIIK